MDFEKKQPTFNPASLIDTISWGDGSRFPKRPVRLPRLTNSTRSALSPNGNMELDLDYLVIDEAGKVKCLSRAGALIHFGDQRSGQGQSPQYHVCASATCVHDYMASPGTNQQQTSTVMPLWEAPLDTTK